MNAIGVKIGESIKVILAVLGIIGSYPNVSIENIFVYRSFNNKEVVDAQFRSVNLINPAIKDIIESGIEVNIIYQVKTSVNDKKIYEGSEAKRISFKEGLFYINGEGGFNYDIFTNTLSVVELPILSNTVNYTNMPIETDIELLINCDATPEIVNLWGNKPRLTLSYSLKE